MSYEERGTSELIEELVLGGDRVSMELVRAIVEREEEAVEELCKLIEDKHYWETEDEDEWWAPIHAVKILGAMGDERAIPALLVCLDRLEEYEDDYQWEWIGEDLPDVFRRIGPAAIGPLMEYLKSDSGKDWYPRAVAADALIRLAADHEERRAEILEFLHSLLKEGEPEDTDFLSSVVISLLDLCDPSSRPVIEEAFERDLIDEFAAIPEDVERAYKEGPRIPEPVNLLEFYTPEAIAERQERWERERREEEKRREERELVERTRRRLLEEGYEIDEFGTVRRKTPKIGPNDPCPCGSGKKYKKCCGRRT